MSETLKELLNMDTVKVGLAAATPYLVHLTNLEALFKMGAAAGAVTYIWLKIYLLYKRNNDE